MGSSEQGAASRSRRARGRSGTAAAVVVALLVVAAFVAGEVLSVRNESSGAPSPSRSSRPSTPSPSASSPPARSPSATPATAAPKPSATAKPVPSPPPKPPPGVPRRPADAQQMVVRYVYDGDTLGLKAPKPGKLVTVTGQVKVRLIGVNAPEMTPKPQCYAVQATGYLKQLTPVGSAVWVAPDKVSWDDYKRRLFYVWTDAGTFVDYSLVAGGYGVPLRIYPNVSHWLLLEAAGAQARSAKKGLWGAC